MWDLIGVLVGLSAEMDAVRGADELPSGATEIIKHIVQIQTAQTTDTLT